MIFDTGKDVFYTTSVSTGKPILRTYLSSEGMIERLHRDTEIFMESLDNINQGILEATKELDKPAYLVEIVVNEGKLQSIKDTIVVFTKEAKMKFFALIDSIIRTFNEIFRSNKKLITDHKKEIYEKSRQLNDVKFDTWIYKLGGDSGPFDRLSDILDNVFYEESAYRALYTMDPAIRTTKDVENILGKLIGKEKANLDTFIKDAKDSIKSDYKKRTLEELGGIDYLFTTLDDLYDQKDSLKGLKKSFTTFMDNFEHVYDLEYYDKNKNPEAMKAKASDPEFDITYDSLYEIYRDVTTISSYSMKYLNIAINMTQENISQIISIFTKILKYKITTEMATPALSSIIMG